MATTRTHHHVLNLPDGASMVDTLTQVLHDAKEVDVAVAFVHMTGLHLLLRTLASLHTGGCVVRVLTSTYLCSTEPQALKSLRAVLGEGLRVQDGPRGFHAKCHLVVSHAGTRVAWVGSSNWTLSGLRDNVEWNARITDEAALDEAREAFEALWRRDDVRAVDDAWIDAYAARWRQRLQERPTPEGIAEQMTRYGAAPQPNALQQRALDALAASRLRGEVRALVVAATGTGKTLLAAFDVERAGAKTLLFIAHRKDIVTQAAKEFAKVFGEGFAHDIVADGARATGKSFVFVTIQSLLGTEGRRLLGAAYDYVVVDEFHHADARGWRSALDKLRAAFLLGLTATPERADGRDVLALCNYNVAFEIRLPDAIRGGFLLPFHYFAIADDEAVDHVKLRGLDEDKLGAALSLTTRAELVLRHAIEKGYDGRKRVAVGFCAGVKHAEFMKAEFVKRGQRAEVVSGVTTGDERARIYASLQDEADPLAWLFVADVLNEGVDLPAVNTVLFLRPTDSSVVFLQQLGRGLRRHPSTHVLTVLDLVGLDRRAFEVMRALHDPHGVPTLRSLATARALGETLTPPPRCEVLLDDKTEAMFEKLRAMTRSPRDRIGEAYQRLRTELGRPPRPVDARSVPELTLSSVRKSYESWRHLRIAMDDAAKWETDVKDGDIADKLLRFVEYDHQQQKVASYAYLWASFDVTEEAEASYERFFATHPEWRVEHKPWNKEKLVNVFEAFARKRSFDRNWWAGRGWSVAVSEVLRVRELREALRERLEATLAKDHELRHEGVLGKPEDAVRFAAYTRREIVNLWGEQYDPPNHGEGVIHPKCYQGHCLLIASIDTGGATSKPPENVLVTRTHFCWSSQKNMRVDNERGAIITQQRTRGVRLHLFVSPNSHAPKRYLGEVQVESYEVGERMKVMFRLPEAVPDGVWEALHGADTSPDDDAP